MSDRRIREFNDVDASGCWSLDACQYSRNKGFAEDPTEGKISFPIRLTTLIYRMSVGTAAATRKLDAKSRADQVTIGMAVTPMNLDQLY